MTSRHTTKTTRRMLLTLATAATVLGAFASATAARVAPPDGESGGSVLVQKLSGLSRVSTSGVLSSGGVFARVDGTGHVVNAKGARVGGMTVEP